MITTGSTASTSARLPASMWLLALLTLLTPSARADVATDGSLGPRVNLTGPDVTIGAGLGQTRGGNLFHSFERFGVDTGGSVTFTGPDGLRNVISRVTGGQASSIDGVLASTIPGADFYLLNPSGVLFGPKAVVDVKGGFHASTADQLRFADGAVFSALDTAGSTLSVAEPQAFGFLGQNAGQLVVLGSTVEAAPGEALSLTAAGITLAGGTLFGQALEAASGSGSIIVAAQRGAGAVPIDPDVPAVPRDGTVQLVPGDAGAFANVLVTGPGGGRIRIETGDLTIDGGIVFALNNAADDGVGGIDIAARTAALQLRQLPGGQGGVIFSVSQGSGRAGPLTLRATESFTIDGGQFASAPFPTGGGGDVTVETGRLTMRGGLLGAPLLVPGQGSSGTTFIVAQESITLSQGAAIFNSSLGDVPAGELIVRSAGPVSLSGGSQISAEALATGRGGSITVEAPSLTVDNSKIAASTISSGDAGDVAVTADRIALVNQGNIASSTSGGGSGGNIRIQVGSLTADATSDLPDTQLTGVAADTGTGTTGDAGSITIDAQSIALLGGSQISGIVRGAGAGGTIDVITDNLTISGQFVRDSQVFPSSILASAETGSSGRAGDISVQADAVTLSTGGAISSATLGDGDGGSVTIRTGALTASGGFVTERDNTASAVSASASAGIGSAGSVAIMADSIVLEGGAQISSSTFTSGRGGSVEVAARSIRVDGLFFDGDIFFPSAILASAERGSTGDGGSVQVRAAELELRDGGRISASTFGAGAGGTVTVAGGNILLAGETAVPRIGALRSGLVAAAETGGSGTAGTVTVSADELTVASGAEVSSRTDSPGAAGSVIVRASQSVTVNGGSIETNSSTNGAAGDVAITAPRVTIKDQGLVGSSGTGAGAAGDVRIQVTKLEAQDGLVRTVGAGSEGGRINIQGSDRIYLRRSEVTSNGIVPEAGASLIALSAPQIVLNASTITSLTGDGAPLAGSGEARLQGDVTVISADSLVAGSSSVVISGLQTNLGSDLQLPANVFLDASRLLRDSCAAGGGSRSSFTRGARGGLPMAPDRPLPSAGADNPIEDRVGNAGPVFLDVCVDTLVQETES